MIEKAAHALFEARKNRTTIAPISETYAISSIEDAYAIASINAELHIANGHSVSGKKVGLTSESVQQQLGVNQPDFGILFSDMEYLNGAGIPANHLVQPKAEAEIAFVMRRDITAKTLSYANFIDAIDYCLPAIEIVDSVITDWNIKLADTIADNASCGLYVLGDQPIAIGSVSLADVEMTLSQNGETVSTGIGKACLGHPLRAAYWLAQIMIKQNTPLKAGEVILSGALGPMVSITAGDTLSVSLSGLGQVSCHLSHDSEK